IVDPPKSIRPGLTAEVTIHAARLSGAVIAPVQTVYEHGRDLFCFVHEGESWRAAPVTLGGSNETFVHIESGVEVGEVIAMAPRTLLREVNLPKLKESDESQEDEPEASDELAVVADQDGATLTDPPNAVDAGTASEPSESDQSAGQV